ncbi:hypothetical protein [Yersinia rohdei]|uniref:hypothetical protein n=1 Tax=Yersinia rohdei TaxID=29485 RepID=UPI0011860E0B|nr:hypothetical protein [Yersinia rohdei]
MPYSTPGSATRITTKSARTLPKWPAATLRWTLSGLSTQLARMTPYGVYISYLSASGGALNTNRSLMLITATFSSFNTQNPP